MMQGASQIATGAAVNGVISGALYYMSDREIAKKSCNCNAFRSWSILKIEEIYEIISGFSYYIHVIFIYIMWCDDRSRNP
jgi:hypothetical protein